MCLKQTVFERGHAGGTNHGNGSLVHSLLAAAAAGGDSGGGGRCGFGRCLYSRRSCLGSPRGGDGQFAGGQAGGVEGHQALLQQFALIGILTILTLTLKRSIGVK